MKASVQEFSLTQGPDYNNALALQSDELWRYPNNGGHEQDLEYIHAHQEVRRQLVEDFESGNLYRSADDFTKLLQAAHSRVGGAYAKAGGRVDHLHPENYGQLDTRYGRFSNVRIEESKVVAAIAARYGDPYGDPDRFVSGEPNTESVRVVRLPGISEYDLPYDVVRYDSEGNVKEVKYRPREDYPNGGYEYMYPDVRYVAEYLEQVQQIGVQIEHAVKSGQGDIDSLLTLIARQYQYGACARPFVQINNSLFMQLANMQVKLLGLPGMTHGQMDLAAQRMQPEGFANYFIARAHGHEA